MVPGHEFYGRIAALGEGAEGKYRIGERVIAEQIVPCWECRYCKSGSYRMCETHNIYGFQKDVAEGGMAEYMRFSENAIVHKIPESLSHEDAVLIEPMACAIHTVARGDIQLDDVVVLAGAGPLGLCMVQVARLKTPKKLIVIDAIDERLALANEFGADVVINPLKEDADQIVKSLTGGYGYDVYIEATGAPIGVTQGLQMIRKLGRFVEFSVFGKETTVDWSIIGDRKELDIRGAPGALQLRNRHRSVRTRAGDFQRRGHPQLFIERLVRSLRPGGLDRLHQGNPGSLTLPPYRCCSHDRRPVPQRKGRPVGQT